MQRRFWIGLALALPVFLLEMGGHLFGPLLAPAVSNWVQLVLATPVVVWAGAPFFERAWQSIVTRNLNMFTLIALGTGAAWTLQHRRHACPRHLSRRLPRSRRHGRGLLRGGRRHHRAGAARPGAGAAGRASATGGAIRALLDLAPKTARLIGKDGSEREVPLDEVAIGDRLRVRPGEKIPVDAQGRSKAAARSTNRW